MYDSIHEKKNKLFKPLRSEGFVSNEAWVDIYNGINISSAVSIDILTRFDSCVLIGP